MDMTRRAVLLAIGVVAMSGGGAAAHDGHTHTIMGTVTARHDKDIQVKTPGGETLTIAVNEKTSVLRNKKKVDPADVKVGVRVVVDIGNGEDPLIAREIQLGVVETAAPKK